MHDALMRSLIASPSLYLDYLPFTCFTQASLVAQMVKRLPAMRETRGRSLGWEDLLEMGRATHSSFWGASLVAQWVKNPPAVQETWAWSLDWEDLLEKGRATHSSIWPGEFRGLYSPWGCNELDMTEWLSLHPDKKKWINTEVAHLLWLLKKAGWGIFYPWWSKGLLFCVIMSARTFQKENPWSQIPIVYKYFCCINPEAANIF